MSNANNYSGIPVLPLPPNAFSAVHDSLLRRGFREQSIQRDYSFSDRDGRLVKPNLLAFAHETSRGPDYTGLTVFNPANGISDEELVQTLAQSGAPFHLIHRHQNERYSFWFTNAKAKNINAIDARKVVEDISYSRLNQVIETYATDIQPQRIIDVKQGRDSFYHFEDAGPFQLALWAIDVTGEKLVSHFGNSVAALRHHQVPLNIIPDLSTQLLGAIILAHTGAFGSSLVAQDVSLESLLTIAAQYFPNYFKPNLFSRYIKAANEAYRILIQLRYSNFSPELLTQLYREAFPDEEQRKELGRYDTPLYLTRRIWQTLPIEFLPPDKRIVADMTCGWGSFLIAGHERLSRMIDMKGTTLRDYIYGNDKEPFAAKLAGLGLLTSTLTDSWNITDQDALEWNLQSVHPGIIVGNPPFHGSRNNPTEEHSDSPGRFEKANQFLNHAIDLLAPDGYLAMLMPQSFMTVESSPQLRKKLLERCDILDLWELPIGVFEARANSLVIIGKKKRSDSWKFSSYPVRVRTVQANQLEDFSKFGRFTASALATNQSAWNEASRRSKRNTHIINYGLILPDHQWNYIKEKCIALKDCAVAFHGSFKGEEESRKQWKNFQSSKEVKWIKNPRDLMLESFLLEYKHAYTLDYPNDFERPRRSREKYLDEEKIIINAVANTSWGKRVKVGIERKGYHVSEHFVVVVPKLSSIIPNLSHEALAAVLDWKVSNAWLVEHLKHARFPITAIRDIPIPLLSSSECILLEKAVQEIETAFENGETPPASAYQGIDDTLRQAYKLNDEVYERLALIARWDLESLSTLDLQIDQKAPWEITGIVEHVDAEKGNIIIWLDGFDELQTVPIVPVMPGWLLRPEAAFRTSIPRRLLDQRSLANNTSWGVFYPQEYAYLSEEEAFTELLETLS